MKFFFKKIFLFSFMFTSLQSKINHNDFIENPNIIFFDIQDTLIFLQEYKTVFNHFSLSESITALFHKNPSEFYYNKISQIPSPHSTPNYKTIGLDGKTIPPLQRDFLLGKLNSTECLKIAHQWINLNDHRFDNDSQIKLFKKMIDFYFNPTIFYKCGAYTSCKKILKKLYEQKTKKNKRKNIIFILSNQSKEQINVLKVLFPEIFSYSDMQIFSSEEGLLKPDLKLFEKCIKLCPKKSSFICLLIDNTIYPNNSFFVADHKIEVIKRNDVKEKLKSEGFI